jgi:hypothetical protein
MKNAIGIAALFAHFVSAMFREKQHARGNSYSAVRKASPIYIPKRHALKYYEKDHKRGKGKRK